MEETNVSGEQIDYSRPWKPRMDQCEEATLLFGQAHLLLPPTRSTNRIIIYLFVTRNLSNMPNMLDISFLYNMNLLLKFIMRSIVDFYNLSFFI